MGSAKRVGIKNSVNKLEKPRPQITAVEKGTHQADISPPNSILRPNQSIVIWSATGVKPIIVVAVVSTIGLNLWAAEWIIVSIGSIWSAFNLLKVSISTIELLTIIPANETIPNPLIITEKTCPVIKRPVRAPTVDKTTVERVIAA